MIYRATCSCGKFRSEMTTAFEIDACPYSRWWNRLWHRLWQVLYPDRQAPERKAHAQLSRLFFCSLIDQAWGGEVRFSVPEHLRDLRELA